MGYLRIYLGNELQEQFDLNRMGRLTIGRARDNDLVIPDAKFSAHHAVIFREGRNFFVQDLGSTNGVFLNNQRVQRAQLKYWDEVQIYNRILKFMALSAPQEGEAPQTDTPSDSVQSSKTQAIELSEEERQALLKRQQKVAFLRFQRGTKEKSFFFEDRITVTIGRSKDNDIRTKGWFAPEIAARIERTRKGFFLTPKPRGKVFHNGNAVAKRTKIQDGDEIQVRNLAFRFYYRVRED